MQKIDFQEKCLLGLSFSRPPAPLNECVIRWVFFCRVSVVCFIYKKLLEHLRYLRDIIFSMPAEPLGSFENLKLNSGGFFCVSFQRLNAKLRNIAL